MADLEKLMRQKRQIEARIKDEQNRRASAERKARNHALMVMGGMLERECGGDWRSIDWRALDRELHAAGLAAKVACEPAETKAATAALRAFEREKRGMGRSSADAAAEAARSASEPPMTARERAVEGFVAESVDAWRRDQG